MTQLKTMGGPGVQGLHPANVDLTISAVVAFTKGDTVQFDFSAGSGTTSKAPGNSASPFYRCVDPAAEGTSLRTLSAGIFGVALADIAAGATGRVRIRGIVNANIETAVVAGAMCVPATDGRLDMATGGTNLKVVAIALEDDSVTTNFADVWFDGLCGFGNDVGSNVSS